MGRALQELVVNFLFRFRSLLSIWLEGVAHKMLFSHQKVIIKIVRHNLKAKNFFSAPVCGYILLIRSNRNEHKKMDLRRKMKGFHFFMLFLCSA